MGTYLVTGGAGFIGSAVARGLLESGNAVVIADNLSTGSLDNVPAGCKFIEMDLADPDQYEPLSSFNFDAVLHLAAQSSGEASFLDPWMDYRSHSMSTFLLLDLCRRRGIGRFLYASSMAVYGDAEYLPVDENHPLQPKSFYAAGKLASESYVRLHSTLGVQTTVFRMFSVYGPNQDLDNKLQGMVSIFLSFLLENRPITVKGSLERSRDFIFLDDVVSAWLQALDNPASFGKTYNLATGVQTSVGGLLSAIKHCAGDPDYPVEVADNTKGDQFGLYGDISRISDDLGWRPSRSLESGIRAMLDFYRNNPGNE